MGSADTTADNILYARSILLVKVVRRSSEDRFEDSEESSGEAVLQLEKLYALNNML